MTAEAMALMDGNDVSELLGRLDERTRNLPQTLCSIDSKIDAHDCRLRDVETAISELSPVKKVVYGGIAAILRAVIGAAMGIVLSRSADTKAIEQAVNKAVEHAAQPAR